MKRARAKEDGPDVQLNVRVPPALRNKIYDYLGPKDKMKYFVRGLIEEFFAAREKKIAKASKK